MDSARFNLRVWFAVAGFAVIALLTAASAVLMCRFLTETMVDREVAVTQEFLQSILATEGYREQVFAADGDRASGPLQEFANHIRAMPENLRANLYCTDRRIVWSTDQTLIGQRFDNNPELEQALAGSLVSEVGWLEGNDKPEHIALAAGAAGRFIEAYLPMRRGATVIGVVELYKVPPALDTAISRGTRIIEISAALGGLVLFATLYWIARRGALLIHRQQAELGRMEALAAVGQMASAIAHSLRNPLAGIRSSAELLRLEHPLTRPAPDEIIGEVDRLNEYVRELMEYARNDAATLQRVDPLDVVCGTLSRQRAALERARVEVTIDDQRRIHRPVEVDPPMLGQAMASIVTNAIEASPRGGRLHIALSDPDGRHTEISFTDSGRGIPAALLARVSEPFFTTKERGLGLGLALARRIVERFNGSLDILSPEHSGAVMRISLRSVRA
jgi:two-component system, NtrC family, sensor histidine kinase HydH